MIDDIIQDLICKGADFQEISKATSLSVSGVKWRIARMKKKYGARNITDLAVKITMLKFCHELL